MNRIRIFIVDDHSMFRTGLIRVFRDENDMLVCAEADTAKKALKLIPLCKPDVAIVDINLPDMDGLQLIKILRKNYPSLKILALSMYDEFLYAGKALKAGANGYLMKEETALKLVEIIRTIKTGKNWISEKVKDEVLKQLSISPTTPDKSPSEVLSCREKQVFRLLGLGYSCKKIAIELKMKRKTVETHRSRIKIKLGIASIPKLIIAANEWVKQDGINVSVL